VFGRLTSPTGLAQIIQVALTPVFFLTAVAALLNVFSTRLGRVADHVDRLSEELEKADTAQSAIVIAQLTYLRRRSRILDFAVVLATLAGIAICCAASLCSWALCGTRLPRPSCIFSSPPDSCSRSERSSCFSSRC
jgi:hypothetical protein